MTAASAILLNIFRQAWVMLVISLVMIGTLAVVAQVLRMTSSSVIGARLWVQQSIGSIAGIILLILFAFLVVPSIVQAGAGAVKGSGASCGPIAELGGFAADLIGALGALRLLRALSYSVLSAAVGGSTGASDAFREAAEVLGTMLIASTAIPIAAAFLGVC